MEKGLCNFVLWKRFISISCLQVLVSDWDRIPLSPQTFCLVKVAASKRFTLINHEINFFYIRIKIFAVIQESKMLKLPMLRHHWKSKSR